MAQGFVKSLNLLETPSDADRGILNNLGGEGIVDDIRLFSGNLKKTSSLLASEYTTDGNVIIVTGDGRVPFSNRTVVRHSNVDYTVTASNAVDRFELRDSSGNPFVPTSDLVRSDAVTFENLSNMNVTRRVAVQDVGSSSGATDASDTSESGIYNLRSIASNYSIIEEGLAIYYYKKSRIPLTYEDSSFSRRLTFTGNIRITNVDNVAQSTTSPGLFIKGPGGSVRAFSDVSNPWSENPTGSKLETTANNAAAYDLVLNGPDLIVPTSEIQSESGNAGDYTHKMKVMVKSGSHDDTNSSYETFYLLLAT